MSPGNNADRDLAERGKRHAKQEQERVASRDYDEQRKKSGRSKPPEPKPSKKPKP